MSDPDLTPDGLRRAVDEWVEVGHLLNGQFADVILSLLDRSLDSDIADSLIELLKQLPLNGAPDVVRSELAVRDRAIGQLSRFV